MNAGVFSLLYSGFLGMVLPVPEHMSLQGKKNSGKHLKISVAILAILFLQFSAASEVFAAPLVNALPIPKSATPTYGAGNISTNGNAMTVTQSTNKMIVEWNNFNIGSNASVNFVQPSASSAILNKVLGTGSSEIYGHLTSNGQVYLINPNGILFGGGSVVNVNTLIASSLSLPNDNVFINGILSSVDRGPVFQGSSASGSVIVDVGANLSTLSGGKIMLFAPTVTNNGVINTPEGQTLLAAGQKIYLANSIDPNLRGVLVEVDAGGSVTNAGDIQANHGNITLAGFAVNQDGRVKATTSVTANGSIRLQARNTTRLLNTGEVVYTDQSQVGGTVVMGASSITEVLPDISDPTTVIDSAAVQTSTVDVIGANVHLMKNAAIVAPGGNVSIFAGQNLLLPTFTNVLSATPNASRIYFETGSLIDVSGVGSVSSAPDRGESAANVQVSNNVVLAELRGNELRDSPLQRNGILYTSKVFVDSRAIGLDGSVGTSVADVSGYTSQIGKTVSQRLSNGGKVSIASEGDIIFSQGASVNVSGGKVDYSGSNVITTYLLASSGQLYDIASAPKDLTYVGIQNLRHFEQGYTQGANAGSVFFSSPAMLLGGSLAGSVILGERQRSIGAYPTGGSLQIGQNVANVGGIDTPLTFTHVLHSDILFDNSFTTNSTPLFNEALTSTEKQTLVLGNNFSSPLGFSNLKYYNDGQITLKSGTSMLTTPGGSILMDGGGVDVLGNMTSVGGTIALTAKSEKAYIGLQDPSYQNNATSSVVVANGITLDVSGGWVNDALTPGSLSPIFITGGSIKLSASAVQGKLDGNVILGNGSFLNASGGAWLNSAGILKSGNGGSITLAASGGYSDSAPHLGKIVMPYGVLRADSLAIGGTLNLTSGSITIGLNPLGSVNGELLLTPSRFSEGGFSNYNINSYEGLVVRDGTTIQPVAYSRVLDRSYVLQPTGADIPRFSHLELLPATGQSVERNTTNLSLTAKSQVSGVLTLEANTNIMMDPSASLSLAANRQLTVLGNIFSPSGQILMTLGHNPSASDRVYYLNNQTLWLGSNSIVDVSAVSDVYRNANGMLVGSVKDAGSITLNALTGEIVANSGATLNLLGSHASIALYSGKSYSLSDVASKGGNLNISAREGVLFDATINAQGGTSRVAGGNFLIGMTSTLDSLINENLSSSDQYPTGPRQIFIESSGSSVPSGLAVGGVINPSLNGASYVFADKLESAGFDAINFVSRDNIRFTQDVSIKTRGAISLDAPNVYIDNGASVALNSAYVGIGNDQAAYQQADAVKLPIIGAPSAKLVVNANYIDLYGNLNLSGASKAAFNSSGDIQLRGILPSDPTVLNPNGTLSAAGNLLFTASRIYPTTLSNYIINTPLDVAFSGNGPDSGVPYSVMGTLTVQAENISQGGVIRAPFGVVNLKANNQLTLQPGSLTSVSAEGKTLPFGTTINGKSWVYDFGDRTAIISTLPDKAINLNGKNVNILSASNTIAAAKVDISGGGELQAWEFTTGTGGTNDVLDGSGTFAVLPGLNAGYMPGNSQSYLNGTLKPGDMIYLSGGNGLAAGNYVLLPAHYALMSGGYFVKPVSGSQDIVAQQNTIKADGSMLVSGYRTQYGGIVADSRTSGFLVASGNVVRTQSEFTNTYANTFFKKAYSDAQLLGLRLPDDVLVMRFIIA